MSMILTDPSCFGRDGRSVDDEPAVFLVRPDLHLAGLLVKQHDRVLVMDAGEK